MELIMSLLPSSLCLTGSQKIIIKNNRFFFSSQNILDPDISDWPDPVCVSLYGCLYRLETEHDHNEVHATLLTL